jgi:hypothetical protein
MGHIMECDSSVYCDMIVSIKVEIDVTLTFDTSSMIFSSKTNSSNFAEYAAPNSFIKSSISKGLSWFLSYSSSLQKNGDVLQYPNILASSGYQQMIDTLSPCLAGVAQMN